MSIFRVDPGFVFSNSVRFNPKRKFISASNGMTGSVYVFPNRSDTQKDNIDERLTDIATLAESDPSTTDDYRAYTQNSLEQRRIEIFAGDFSKYGSGQGFIDFASDAERGLPTNYEVNLALLLDGASPFEGINNWPPEISKHNAIMLNTNYAHTGYSDLPMHPRNAYQKHIIMRKADNNAFSSGSRYLQRVVRLMDPFNPRQSNGWNYTNFSTMKFFSVSSHGDNVTALYPSINGEYALSATTGWTIEFWIKPTHKNTAATCVMHYPGHFAIWLVPTSFNSATNRPTKFKLRFVWDDDANVDDHPGGAGNGWQSSTHESDESVISLDRWSSCSVRWGPNFNEGRLSFVIDGHICRGGGTTFTNAITNATDGCALSIGAFNANSYVTPVEETCSLTVGSATTVDKEYICFIDPIDGVTKHVFFMDDFSTSAARGAFQDKPSNPGTMWSIRDNNDMSGTIRLDVSTLTDIGGVDFSSVKPTIIACEGKTTTQIATAIYNELVGAGKLYDNTTGVWNTSSSAALPITKSTNVLTFTLGNAKKTTDASAAAGDYSHPRISGGSASSNISTFFRVFGSGGVATTAFTVSVTKISENYGPGQSRKYFSTKTNQQQGVKPLLPYTTTPPVNKFYSGLDAEIHELRIWNYPRTVYEIDSGIKRGIDLGISASLMQMYVPLLYCSSSYQEFYPMVPETGAIYQYQWFNYGSSVTTSSNWDSPINTNYAFMAGVDMINIHSYLKDFKRDTWPYVTNLDVNVSSGQFISAISASWGDTYAHAQRTAFVFPCDNGRFAPNFNILSQSDSSRYDPSTSFISMKKLGKMDDTNDVAYAFGDEAWSGSLGIQNIYEFNAKMDDFDRVSPLSSVFSVPIIYYGDRIQPNSFKLTGWIANHAASGSITTHLVDNGSGAIIRSDCSGSVAKYNKVGQIYYESGVIALISPHLYQFGNGFWKMEFKGEKKLHVWEVNVPCYPGKVNLSNNPTYVDLKPNADKDEDPGFVYISGINLHDENLNVIGKCRLARPIVKRDQDTFMFRLKLDY